MKPLKDKTVLVTGASSGIGLACAHAFAGVGARLIISARRKERLAELRESLKSEYGVDVESLCLDVSDRAAVEREIANLETPWSEVEVLVNNAGLAAGSDLANEASLDDWEAMIDTNLKGVLYMTRLLLTGMTARDSGHIINLGSVAGVETYQGGSVYCLTKFGVRAFSQALKKDLLGTDIRVTCIEPGAVETEFSKVRFRGDEQKASAVYQGMRPLTAEDIAETILFCATRPAHVNISELVVLATDQSSAKDIYRREA